MERANQRNQKLALELKNVNINLKFSQETIQYRANLYVNNTKVAYFENDGFGSCTNVLTERKKEALDLFDAANEYVKIIKDAESNKKFKYDITNWVDEQIIDILNKKLDDKNNKKLLRDMQKGIVFGDKNRYKIISWKNSTIKQLLEDTQHKNLIREKVQMLLKNGENILNTNIPSEFFQIEIYK
jgi:hypothetical protein